MNELSWERWPNFQEWEFCCSKTGRCDMDEGFLDRLQALRKALGVPIIVTSGFRDPSHPVEAVKAEPGTHTLGLAADIKAESGKFKYQILREAMKLGFTGIGIGKSFVHLDIWMGAPRPNVWIY